MVFSTIYRVWLRVVIAVRDRQARALDQAGANVEAAVAAARDHHAHFKRRAKLRRAQAEAARCALHQLP